MNGFAVGELLAQSRPGVTTAVTLFTATMRTEITLIVGVILSGTPAIEVYHDDDGTTFDETTQLYLRTGAVNDSPIIFQAAAPGGGLMLKAGASLGVQIDTASAVNFSLYGITEKLAERVRGLSNVRG